MNTDMRLSNHTWQSPRYDRAGVCCGVVHLGLGAFHRAHQVPVFDQLIATGDRRWGIAGVAMRSPTVVTALAAQDGLYSLWQRGPGHPVPQVMAALCRVHNAAQDPDAVIATLAHAHTHLVTLTVTEKGYLDHSANSPAGLLARALDRRRRAGYAPLTLLSCDNRTGNGPVTRTAVLAAAQQAALADATLHWIEEQVAFPSSMVDRITPASTPDTISASSQALGLRDEAAVWTEPYWQWVVEDRFAALAPDLARAGVQLVAEVAPWEMAKLRLLNAAHSTLAYGGLLRGHRYVHQAMADPALAGLIQRLWDEASVTLAGTAVNVSVYRAALRDRFGNAQLPHALLQIGADGSQKLPLRILSTMQDRAASGLTSPALALAMAAWIHSLSRVVDLADPLLHVLKPIASHTDAPDIRVQRLLEHIDPQAAVNATIRTEIALACASLHQGNDISMP